MDNRTMGRKSRRLWTEIMARRQKNTFFQFKKFTVYQDKSAMKVCTDACIFGAVSMFPSAETILDIGTGTGLLSFMLAQRYPTSQITALEIDENAVQQARENSAESPFAKRITILQTPVQDYYTDGSALFSGIICNPPFYENALKSTNNQKNVAHHHTMLTFNELVDAVHRLLEPKGVCWILLPPTEMEKLSRIFTKKSFFKTKSISISHQPGKPIIREICCFERNNRDISIEIEQLSIFETDGAYTSRIKDVLKEFYLIF